MHIVLSKGLNIPLKGGFSPKGTFSRLLSKSKSSASTDQHYEVTPIELYEGSTFGAMLGGFPVERFALLVQEGDSVKMGDVIAYNKACQKHRFVAPASGKIGKVHRGPKRRIVAIEIIPDSLENQTQKTWVIPHKDALIQEKIELLSQSGILTQIRQRPFALLPDLSVTPRAIFVNAMATGPYAPPVDLVVDGKTKEINAALEFLKPFCSGPIHLTYSHQAKAEALLQAKHCEHHTISGPHPSGQVSVHIHHIDPIISLDDVVWTLDVEVLLSLGHLICHRELPTHRIISICGEGVMQERRGLYQVPVGVSVSDLMAGRCTEQSTRMLSGDPLTGLSVEPTEFLHPFHRTFSCMKSPKGREFLHFFRLGVSKFSSHFSYLSGAQHALIGKKHYSFTTNNHGEHRAMIDGEIYQRVLPMQIPIMHLINAVLSGDLELAQELGLLEIEADDFALPSFICPCKTEMVSLMERALYQWGLELSS